MKILMLCDKMDIGGAETHVFTLIKALLKDGHKLSIMTSGGGYINTLVQLGVEWIYAPFDRRSAVAIIKSYKILKKHIRHFEIVHAHTRLTAFLAQKARGRTLTPGIVATAHLNFNPRGIGRFAKWGDITLAVSNDIKQYLMLEYNISPNKIIVTVNGVSTESRIPNDKKEKRIFHTSRIDIDRADTAFLLCDIAEDIYASHPEYRIDIVGDGLRFNELKQRVAEINHRIGEEFIILHGKIYDVENIISCGDIFVGVSRAAIEAIASGLATIISGNEGYGGILCKENFSNLKFSNLCARGLDKANTEKLKHDILKLIEDKTFKEQVLTEQRQLILSKYTDKKMMGDAINAYLAVRPNSGFCALGYCGYGNLGDEETLLSLCKLTKEMGASIEYIISSDANRCYSDIKCTGRYNILKIRRALLSSRGLILSGGNLLQNETSNRSLIYYYAIILYAKRIGLPVYMISSGIGRLRGKFANYIGKKWLKSCDFIGLRTSYDLSYARLLECNSAVFMPDLCYARSYPTLGHDGSCLIIIKDGNSISHQLIHTIKAIGFKIVVYKTQAKILKSKRKICHANGIDIIGQAAPQDLINLMSSATIIISERLHGGIIGITMRKPCFLLSESAKACAQIKEIANAAHSMGIQAPLQSTDKISKENIVNILRRCYLHSAPSLSPNSDKKENVLQQSECLFAASKKVEANCLDLNKLLNYLRNQIIDKINKLF